MKAFLIFYYTLLIKYQSNFKHSKGESLVLRYNTRIVEWLKLLHTKIYYLTVY